MLKLLYAAHSSKYNQKVNKITSSVFFILHLSELHSVIYLCLYHKNILSTNVNIEFYSSKSESNNLFVNYTGFPFSPTAAT